MGEIRIVCMGDWLISCFEINSPLRESFSLYLVRLQERGRKNREMIDQRKKCPNKPHKHPL